MAATDIGGCIHGQYSMRKTTVDDVKQICDIYNYYVNLPNDMTTFEETNVSENQMLERLESIFRVNFPHIVAVDENDVVVGFAYGMPFHSRVSYRFSAENSVYLNPSYTGKGVGSLLLRELLGALKDLGIKQVVAIIGTKKDNPGSYALHAKHGFIEAAYFKKIGFKHGKWVDRVHVQCDLERFLD